MTGNETPMEVQPARDWDRSGHRFGSTAKARKELGFEAKVGLEDGLGRTIDWMREHMELIDGCIARHAHRLDDAVARQPSVA